ncbi:MAG TPA: amidohydrolase family protein [Chloroflexota bacterium]|nr:amidohydrolase family protein [Chloroflexota bacterium]
MLLDVHGHPPPDRSRLPGLLAALERWDSRLLLSDLGARDTGWVHAPEVRHWQEGNEQCAELVRQHPDRLLGYCYVNPAHGREALAEMERRLLGEPETFGALKLWVAVRCSDPCLDPLMELCAAHDVPVLQHTWIKAGPQGPGSGNLAGESTPEDLLALARRHPRVRFFGGHIGGDWEWGVAALKQVDNVWLDVAGGDASGGYMEAALAGVGAGRIVYGTDVTGRSIPSQLAKILAVDLSETDREKILWQNAAHVLGKRLPPAWREAFGRGGAAEGAQAPEGRRGRGTAPRLPPPPPGGYLDANAFLGEWPGRRLNGSPPPVREALVPARLAQMDALGIRRAAVSLLEGTFLKDSGVANAELRTLTALAPQRLFPVYTLNPLFPAWNEHLQRCLQDYGLAPGTGALRLSPAYHGYPLDHPALEACLDRLQALGLPVVLTWQLEDTRMQGTAMQVPDLDPAAVAALATRRPGLRLVLTGAVGNQILATARHLPPEARVWFDLSRVQGPVDGVLHLCREVGPGRLLFGTNVPLHVAASPVLEVADAVAAGLPEGDAGALRYANAGVALGLTPLQDERHPAPPAGLSSER